MWNVLIFVSEGIFLSINPYFSGVIVLTASVCEPGGIAGVDNAPGTRKVGSMLTLVLVLKLWVEIALWALAGRWVLSLLLRGESHGNVFYELLRVVTGPVVGLVGKVLPRGVHERHHTFIAACLLCLLWIGATIGKVWLCLGLGPAQCQ